MPITRAHIYKLVVIGTIAGLFSGLFGVGGGTVMVPLLVLWLAYDERVATGTSLVAIIVIAAVGVATHALYGNVRVFAAVLVSLPAIAGVLAGIALQQRISRRSLVVGFAFLLILIALKLIFGLELSATDSNGSDLVASGVGLLVVAGFFAGVLAGLFGVGGGILFVPALSLVLGFDQVTAEATSLLAIIPVSIVGSVRQYSHGNAKVKEGLLLGALAVAGAVLGVVLVNLLPERAIEIGFALLTIFVAGRLLHSSRNEDSPQAVTD